jgi:hypothetical protein
MDISRRNALIATAGSVLLTAALATAAEADEGKNGGDTLYGHGMVWNRDLPGILGQLRLSFDLRVNTETGIGFGTCTDPATPDFNSHFAITSITQEKAPKGETRFTMFGAVTESNNRAHVGLPVAIIAETAGDATAIAIRIGEHAFGGAGVVTLEYLALAIFLGMVLVGAAR